MKFIGDRLGRPEKAKWDWIKCKTNRHVLLLHGGDGTVNSY